MLSQNFDLWVACQRVFNVTPAIVDDNRTLDGGGVVRFLTTTRSDNYGVFLEEMFEREDAVLATGLMDEEDTERIIAIEDDFDGESRYMVVRAAPSYLDEDTISLEVEVFLESSPATLVQVIETVRQCSREGTFENLLDERMEAETPAEAPMDVPPPAKEAPQQGRSLLDRWFRKRS
jgi:hypothetical protein